mgnify:CR=1 FL=1
MTEISITRMSSKGQVVIPQDVRAGFIEGEKIVVIRNVNQIILKKAKDFNKNLEDDLKFAKKTEEALKRYENGEFMEKDFDSFLEDMKKC